jgi:hypothetical protein
MGENDAREQLNEEEREKGVNQNVEEECKNAILFYM